MATKTRKLNLRTLKLETGSHSPDGVMCVMEAVAYVAGENWSDHPKCVSPVIGAFLRSWNDSLDDKTRQQLKPYIRRIIGTRTTQADEQTRAWLATDWLARTYTPAWLRKAGLNEEAAGLEALPELTSAKLADAAMPAIRTAQQKAAAARDAAWIAAGTAARAAVRTARDAAGVAAGAAVRTARDAAGVAARAAVRTARDAAWTAAWDAAWTAAWDAAWTARDAAWDAAWTAAWDAAWTAAGDPAWDALKDTVNELQASAFDLLDSMIAVGAEGKRT